MARTRPPYSPEFRRQMVDLVRAGRSPKDLAREFEPTAQSIGPWAAAAAVSSLPIRTEQVIHSGRVSKILSSRFVSLFLFSNQVDRRRIVTSWGRNVTSWGPNVTFGGISVT